MQFKGLITQIGGALLLSIALPIFAEEAPVFDADKPSDFIEPVQTTAHAAPASNDDVAEPSASAPPAYHSGLSAEQRLKKLEQQINNLENSDQMTRMESIQKETQALRGQVEELTHQLEQLQAQQRAMFADVDKRLAQQSGAQAKVSEPVTPDTTDMQLPAVQAKAGLSKPQIALESKPVAAKSPEVKTQKLETPQPNAAQEQAIYQTAYNLIKEKKYSEAVNALQKMIQKYPTGQFAANAHYWLGELYGLMGKNDQALTEFETVVKKFPNSPRISDAHLKLGLIFAARSQWPDAKTAFKKVISRYPGTSSAQLASEQLKQIKLAGH